MRCFGVIMISRGSFQDLGMTETTGASLPKCWLPVSTCSEEPLMSTRLYGDRTVPGCGKPELLPDHERTGKDGAGGAGSAEGQIQG